ncbi:HlyD family efflux transporter periplasmic adaptor subunit [Marinifilum sp. JC120]|nr:HlyD family efflux transporter periplasmic adaptor subunit [Marinifilum sp. JC120]
MPVRTENKSLRKSHRINLPATIEIEGQRYKVLDWSLNGVRAEICKGILPENWEGTASFSLPLKHMALSFDATVMLRRQDKESAGFSFESISEQGKTILSSYVKASIEGQIDDVEGFIEKVEAGFSAVTTEAPLTHSERQQFKRSFYGRSVLLMPFIISALLLVSFIFYNSISLARSTRAVVSGGLIDSATEISAFLDNIQVQEGQTVQKGDLLFTLDDTELRRKIEDSKNVMEIEKEKLNYLYVALQEEAKSVGMYRKAAQHELKRLRHKLDGVVAEIDTAKNEFDRASDLVKAGATSKSYWDIRNKDLRSLEAERNALTEQLLLAEENSKSSENGKFLSDGKVQGQIRELEAKIKVQERIVEMSEQDLARQVTLFEKTRVLSKTDGTVYSITQEPGNYINKGTNVVTLAATKSNPWILASFTFEEAQRIAPGAQAMVYIPSLDITCKGTVQAMGLKAMKTKQSGPLGLEITRKEVPVKINLVNLPTSLVAGLGANVSIETSYDKMLKNIF